MNVNIDLFYNEEKDCFTINFKKAEGIILTMDFTQQEFEQIGSAMTSIVHQVNCKKANEYAATQLCENAKLIPFDEDLPNETN